MSKRKRGFDIPVYVILIIGILLSVVVWLGSNDEGVMFAPRSLEKGSLSISQETQPVLSDVGLFDQASIQKRMDDILRYGEPVTKSGTLEVIHYDDFENNRSENQYFIIEDSGKRSRVYFNRELLFISGTEIRIEGKILQVDGESEIVAESYEIISEGGVAGVGENPNLDEQKTVVILVNSMENPVEPITLGEAWNRVFNVSYDRNGDGLSDSINSWMKEVSYEKAWFTGDVFGWYTLNIAERDLCDIIDYWDPTGPFNEAMNAADFDVNFTEYDRLMFVIPYVVNCPYLGVAYVGMIPEEFFETPDGNRTYSIAELNGVEQIDNGVGVHEFGHNFGVFHANYWDCENLVVGPDCLTWNYGDPFDLMGGSNLVEMYGALDVS